jgi:hypothetical protein
VARVLIGYFYGPKPNLLKVVEWVGSSWAIMVKGKDQICVLQRGFFSFRFENIVGKNVV